MREEKIYTTDIFKWKIRSSIAEDDIPQTKIERNLRRFKKRLQNKTGACSAASLVVFRLWRIASLLRCRARCGNLINYAATVYMSCNAKAVILGTDVYNVMKIDLLNPSFGTHT